MFVKEAYRVQYLAVRYRPYLEQRYDIVYAYCPELLDIAYAVVRVADAVSAFFYQIQRRGLVGLRLAGGRPR